MVRVLGIDSSTQATKALLVDAGSGEVLVERRVAHPVGTCVDPRVWRGAVDEAVGPLVGEADVFSVAGQQHGMVLVDERMEPTHDALLWNDVRSAGEAVELMEFLGGAGASVERIGSVPVASFTATKVRWVAVHDPAAVERARRVMLPHDYVTWHLSGAWPDSVVVTDHGDASGTGYYRTDTREWDLELLYWATGGRELALPELPSSPSQLYRCEGSPVAHAAGTGDNMAAVLGLQLSEGDVAVSIGTSGVCSMSSVVRPVDVTGSVTGFADATGHFLPMTTTINASRILDFGCSVLNVGYEELSVLALSAPVGARGLTLLPYFDGERTPNRPRARGTLHGLCGSTSREDIARAVVEALLFSLADGIGELSRVTGRMPSRVVLTGGGARSRAVRVLASGVFGVPVCVPDAGEYVALGAARQAVWALAGTVEPPVWERVGVPATTDVSVAPESLINTYQEAKEAYAQLKERTQEW